MQVLPISFAVLLTPVSVFFAYYGVLQKKILLPILAVFLMMWAFSTYQLFVVLIAATIAFCFILHILASKPEESVKKNIKLLSSLILIFVIAFAVNELISRLFFYTPDYMQNAYLWGKLETSQCIRQIFYAVKRVLLGDGIFYSLSYLVTIVLLCAIFIYNAWKEKKRPNPMLILGVIFLWVSPFLLTAFFAYQPAVRAQFDLSFAIACNVLLILMWVMKQNKSLYKISAFVLVAVILGTQTQALARLFYTDTVCTNSDADVFRQIAQQIVQIDNYQAKPVAVIGTREAKLNAACTRGEIIGTSLMAFDAQLTPRYFSSSQRIVNGLKNLGLEINLPSEQDVAAARQIAIDMPVWPIEGSVKDCESMIVVKISPDLYLASDGLISSFGNIQNFNPTYSNDQFRFSIDTKQVKDGQLTLSGWLLKNYEDSNNSMVSVYFYDEQSGSAYMLYTNSVNRPDVQTAFPDEADYTKSGFSVTVPVSQLPQGFEQSKIVLGYHQDEQTWYVQTDQTVK